MLPQVGTGDYLASLIQHLQTNLPDIDLDRNVFLGILLCLIAGQRNLIIDVDVEEEEDDDESSDGGVKGKIKERERRIQSRLERVCNMCQAVSQDVSTLMERNRVLIVLSPIFRFADEYSTLTPKPRAFLPDGLPELSPPLSLAVSTLSTVPRQPPTLDLADH